MIEVFFGFYGLMTILVGGWIVAIYSLAASTKQRKSIRVVAPAEASIDWKPCFDTPVEAANDPQNTIQCFDPATGWYLGQQPVTQPAAVKDIVEAAKEAQKCYLKSSFAKRRQVLRTLLDYLVEHQELICRIAARDSGKHLVDASFGEILTTCEKLRWTIDNGETVLASETRSPGLIMAHKLPRVDYVPVGVMGCIVSWNYPFHNVVGPIISALMAGNGCVVKASEQVAWSTAFWQDLIHACLAANGIDTRLVSIINGYGQTGQALVECCDKITFIGSPGVGKIIMNHASKTLTPVILELGGKDCAIVCEDADYNQFRHNSLRYCFQNAGQNCAGLERVIIHHSLHDRFIRDTVESVSKMRIGSPLLEDIDCGAITMPSQLEIIQSLVDDAVTKGAIVHIGGKRFINPKYPDGNYFLPTIISGITMDMRIAKEEIFGPVMLVMKFNTDDEAIELANSSPFGLGGGVFTLNRQRGESIAYRMRVGFVNLNDFGVNYLCQGLPFGGVGISGVDRFSGVEGLRGNCHPRAVTTDKFDFMGIRTNLPPVLRYPIAPVGKQFQENIVKLLYASAWRDKLNALKEVATISIFGSK